MLMHIEGRKSLLKAQETLPERSTLRYIYCDFFVRLDYHVIFPFYLLFSMGYMTEVKYRTICLFLLDSGAIRGLWLLIHLCSFGFSLEII